MTKVFLPETRWERRSSDRIEVKRRRREHKLTCKEHVHVADDAVMDYNQHPKREEGRVLQNYIQSNAPNVNRAATVRATSI